MKALVTSDLHLTGAPRDDYRWRIFPWLAEQAVKHGAKDIYILGDLTDAKDYHSSRLVNRMVEALQALYQHGGIHFIHLLRANHDGLDPNCPFFLFLGKFPWVRYYATPFMMPGLGGQVLMLPHEREPARAWAALENLDAASVVFMHGTFAGAKSETGFVMPGLSLDVLRPFYRAKIYSGDVHVPQTIGPVEYIGAPYPVRFGDSFPPRVLLLENAKKGSNLTPPHHARVVITVNAQGIPDGSSLDRLADVLPGDQVKVRIRLSPEEYMDWGKAKQITLKFFERNKLELCGLELERAQPKQQGRFTIKRKAGQVTRPEDILARYCEQKQITGLTAEIGKELL